MTRYKTGRRIALAVSAMGWLVVAFSALLVLLVVARLFMPGFGLALLPTLVGLAATGLVVVLVGHLAAALFDVADSLAGQPQHAPNNSSKPTPLRGAA